MPTWTCQKCGTKVENFGWDSAPWKSHRCAAAQTKESIPIASVASSPIAAPAALPDANSVLSPSPAVPLQEPAGEAPHSQETTAVPTDPASPSTSSSAAGTAGTFFQKAKRSDLSGFL